MAQVVIENPVINSAFEEPKQHFRFTDDGITNEIDPGRRSSSYFVPIAKPRRKGQKQLSFDTEWTKDRIEENKLVNSIRKRIKQWREGGYQGVTATTRRLLEYWTNRDRERKLFFCQIEALETAIYITEAAKRFGDTWIENDLKAANDSSNPGLPRIALKMATGSGKTVVMAMIIAWHTLNKIANPQDSRFSDTFLIITPGITIRDRLRVLLPNDPQNYYRLRDIVTGEELVRIEQAKILITNFHAFLPRERSDGARLTKQLAGQNDTGINKESPERMVRRVCRELGNKKQIIVLNDEAHHCYRRKPDGEEVKLTGDDLDESKQREEDARVWISGITAVKDKIGIKAIYDLSATPFFLRGSGYPEATLFPWVVSDFSLIDAIESGIVKVPRVPVSDDSGTGDQPTYRDLWLRIREHLPHKGRRTQPVTGEPKLPVELESALHSLYGNYKKYYALWENNEEARAKGITPPVFIVVCNNTNVSKLVFEWIAGWDKPLKNGTTVAQAGHLDIFRNDDGRGGWHARPNTILVDSRQLESGEGMSPEFKKIAAREIEEFKQEYQVRYPGRDADSVSEEDLLREVMNTVGKAGKLGEHVKCVVSVSMLTEGWDANTVTHVLGVRAFGTQLLCEQVVGRALRRMSYAADGHGRFEAEYAEVYGVPFSFIPCSGSTKDPKPGPIPTRVRALESRIECEITFPRVAGYRYRLPDERLDTRLNFTDEAHLSLSTHDVPSKTENAPIVGESSIHTLDDLKRKRLQEVAFLLAKLTLEKYFRQDGQDRTDRPAIHRFDGEVKAWLFPQLLQITRRWINECLTLKDNAFPQLLLLLEFAHDASDLIYKSIVSAHTSPDARLPTLEPILHPYDTIGTTRYVDFDTTKAVLATREDKCHISHVVADTDSWEQKLAETLEDMDEVVRYVKNQNLGFTIPYMINGEERKYHPDFIACIDDARGSDDLLNLIIEVTGEKKKDKAAKVSTAKTLWIPAVNNHGGFGRWDFIEISDPWDAGNLIRKAIADQPKNHPQEVSA
ncbi:MAG: DEAD/DEAH box helicase family protein [Phycisphaerales bacterium]|nr:DEAD/DEAH box helicase family protein [Phycisphaerales bacterium]